MKSLRVVLFVFFVLASLSPNSSFAKSDNSNKKAKDRVEVLKAKGKGPKENFRGQSSVEKREHKEKSFNGRSKNEVAIKDVVQKDKSHKLSEVKNNNPQKSRRYLKKENVPQNSKKDQVKGALKALSKARWSYNPHDSRSQGNNGRPKMLDPFGFDKDSDRKELYGNNGRPIRDKDEDGSAEDDVEEPDNEPVDEPVENPVVDEPVTAEPITEEPVVTPIIDEPLVLDASIDFTAINDMEWLVNWYEGTVNNYYTNEAIQESYTYDEWQNLWYNHFFPGGDMESSTGIRLNNTWDTSDRYSFDINLNDYQSETLIVDTKMTLTDGYDGYIRYTDDSGLTQIDSTQHESGEVVYEKTTEVTYDPLTGAVNIGITATDDLLDSTSGEVYVALEVTITDPETGATYTQSYDKALYLYRCPYGKVYNTFTRQAIVGAKVTVHYEDGSIVILDKASNPTAGNPQYSDATGRYGCKLQSNRKYYITASAPGYEPYRSEIFTEKWHVLREDIALKPMLN